MKQLPTLHCVWFKSLELHLARLYHCRYEHKTVVVPILEWRFYLSFFPDRIQFSHRQHLNLDNIIHKQVKK